MANRVLFVTEDSLDRTDTFRLNVGTRVPKTCSLRTGYKKRGDGTFWILQHSTGLQDSFSQAELDERARLDSEEVLKDGDTVVVGGAEFKIKILGNYSDCAILVPFTLPTLA